MSTLIVVSTHAVTAAVSVHVDTPVRTSRMAATVAAAICIMPSVNRSCPSVSGPCAPCATFAYANLDGEKNATDNSVKPPNRQGTGLGTQLRVRHRLDTSGSEAVALVCLEALGLPGAEQSRGYLQHWNERRGAEPIPERSAQRIFKAADQILKAGTLEGSEPTVGR
jgi:hypothetical protein